jgi:molecular chaperone Hsp33
MIVVDLDAPNGLRGYARFDKEAVDKLIEAGEISHAHLLGTGHLAMTVDQGAHMERYQGIVAVDGNNFEEMADEYFMQSEQIPTIVRVAVAEHSEKGGSRPKWRAAGVLVQYLPGDALDRIPDLPGDGDFENPETADPRFVEHNNWTEAKSLTSTVTDLELVDPDVSPERLLFRLFHEQGVRVFDPQIMEERCTCSPERIEDMLRNSFSSEDRHDMQVDGEIEVVCEFCSTAYHFDPSQFETEH